MQTKQQTESGILTGLALLAGLLVPIALGGGAVWFGIIQRDIVYVAGLSWSVNRTSMDIRGTAAILTGIAFLGMAVAVHGGLFWRLAMRQKALGTGLVVIGTLAFLGFLIAAMVTKSMVDRGVIEDARPLSEIERFQIQADEELRQRAIRQGREPPPPLHSEGIRRIE